MRALVLSAETPSACALVRSLHAVGFEVVVLAESAISPAAMSWRCERAVRVGAAWTSESLVHRVREIAPSVVVPATEGDLLRLAPVRAEVEALARVVAPAADVLDVALDKAAIARDAPAWGVAVPLQAVLDARDRHWNAPAGDFPMVAKPARSRALRPDGTVWSGTARYVPDIAALRALHAEWAAAGVDTIVQAPVTGAAICVSLLLREDGAPSLVFVHRRVRESRPEGGPSACAVSEPPEARWVDPALRAARGLRLLGVPAQFEFRVPEGGEPLLLDVNPRPWGTLGLPLDCGVNFFGLAARHALGDPLPAPPPPYRAGVRRHYLPFELLHAWTVVAGRRQPGFTGDWPDAASAAVQWIFPPNEGLVGRLDDPMPAVGDALRHLRRALFGR